ncbi:MAG: DUF2163 domain-containing protein [bacterium]
MSAREDLIAHLQTAASTTCRAWSVVRKDGQIYGFTDHDEDLIFDGMIFKANTGLTAGALQSSVGMAVSNSEVTGGFSDEAIREVDISAGRFDGAAVTNWLVNWAEPEQRTVRFKGNFGEIRYDAGTFTVELRGLTEALNQTAGRVYSNNCTAELGDRQCKFDLSAPGYSEQGTVTAVLEPGKYLISTGSNQAARWFDRGRAMVLTGEAEGLTASIKFDGQKASQRQIDLWIDFGIAAVVGDVIRLETGCDKVSETCRTKFSNFLNFRGFPNVPSSDWATSYPVSSQRNDGGSRLK